MRSDLKSWAQKALKQSKDRPAAATTILVNAGNKDRDLRDLLMLQGAKQVIRDYFGAQRISAMSMATGRVKANLNNPDVADRVVGRIARQQFWDVYTLYGMTPIREATREMLEESASNREAQAAGEIRLAKFERAVAARLPNAKAKVRDNISIAQLEKMASKFRAVKQ
jgi:hypothetical protein